MLRGRGGRLQPNPSFRQQAPFGGNGPDKAASNAKSLMKMVRDARTTGKLNLSNLNLEAIPDTVFTREDVKPADVTLDRSDKDGFNWWEEVDISKLIIADNVLKELDQRIAELGALTLLDVHNNALTALPDLSSLQNLTILNLSSNNLTELPESIFTLPLVELHLSNNQFKALPSTLARAAPTLTVLDASKNQLESLPPDFSTLRLLTRLDLSSNRLTELPPLALPANYALTLFDVSHNRLTTLGDLSGCRRLQELLAAENALTVVFSRRVATPADAAAAPRAHDLPELLKLDLRVNRLDSLACRFVTVSPGTAELRPVPSADPAATLLHVRTPKLKDLLLSSNRLVSVAALPAQPPPSDAPPAAIRQIHADAAAKTGGIVETALATIETLDVRDNAFVHVPAEAVVSMPALARLFVEGNPIRFPRRTILEKGTATILKYLRDKQPEA
ncbi:Leucine-rich repeat-containing protein 40 [Phlyctochytrium bullatum]|nr:Leucine-rich repeat-containing protein 40 [Phlyctochytrium bullatum]